MLRSEVLKIVEFATEELKKPILMRYTVAIDMKVSMPYDQEALSFIETIKSLPETLQSVELYYEISDVRLTHLNRQMIYIKVDHEPYFTLVMDDDLELFFTFIRLFKNYETHVESYEQIVTHGMLASILNKYELIRSNKESFSEVSKG
ncbi:MAG: hypothetical protein ACRCST_01685 [Turicibacter sp.]